MKKRVLLIMLCIVLVCVGLCVSKPTVKTSKKTLTVGQTATVTFKPNGLKKSKWSKATWSSSNKKVVKITTKKTKGKKKVKIKAVKSGKAYIRVKCNKKTYKVKITVKSKGTSSDKTTENKSTDNKKTETTKDPVKPSTGFTIKLNGSADMRKNDVMVIESNKKVYYAASEKDFFSDYPCVEVTENGIVTAKCVGTTQILVTTNKSKANAYMLGSEYKYDSADCAIVTVTVGFDELKPQYTDYKLKPAFDVSYRPICVNEDNYFIVSNHTNTNIADSIKIKDNITSCVYDIIETEFTEIGTNTINIYETNPKGEDVYAYSGRSCGNGRVFANSVTVNVVDMWDIYIKAITDAYKKKNGTVDEGIFLYANSYMLSQPSSMMNSKWVHMVSDSYGFTLLSKPCENKSPLNHTGDCVSQAWWQKNLFNRLVKANPSLSAYTFYVEPAPDGGINHHNLVWYKNGSYLKRTDIASSKMAYYIVIFDTSNEYPFSIKWYDTGEEYLRALNGIHYTILD